MDHADSLPTDLAECHRLLLVAYKQAVQLERRATESERRATNSEQRIAELDRVLNATSASYEELQHEHASMLEELAWYKRWVHGRRRERVIERKGQQHLFDLTPPGAAEAPAALASRAPHQEIAGHSRRRPHQRELDLSCLPHHRHEQDLPDAEKICSGCRRAKDRIGEEVTRVLEYVPSKLEVHEHVRPKYANGCDHGGVLIAPVPTPEDIESLTFEVLETGRVGDAQQMAGAKDGFAVAKRIGGMNVAFDHLIVHQAIDHVGALATRCPEHQRVP